MLRNFTEVKTINNALSNVFKAYDIRGIYPSEINERSFYEIGRRIKNLKIKKIAVGRDARLSSQSLFNSFTEGIIDSGIDVIDIGLVTSPMLYFFCITNKIHGAMITASHNPKEYNGLKLTGPKGTYIGYDNGLNRIEKLMKEKPEEKAKKIGNIKYKDTRVDYEKHIQKKFADKFPKKLVVVFDASNGVGAIPRSALDDLHFDYVFLNEKPAGDFPNHGCDVMKQKNLFELQKKVRERKADLGVIFDGDADRCVFVDEKGNIVRMDFAFLLLALHELKSKKGSFYYDLRFSRIVAEKIRENLGEPKIVRVGRIFIKNAINKDKKSIAGGELSGHIFFKENFGTDDALFASLKMIEVLSSSPLKMSEMLSTFNEYHSSGELNYQVGNAEQSMKKLFLEYEDRKPEHIDGISVDAGDVWFNARPSNTEPVMRVVIEGKSKEIVESQRKLIELQLKTAED